MDRAVRRSNSVSSTDLLLNVGTAAQLFHATDGTGFADLTIDNHCSGYDGLIRAANPMRSTRRKHAQAWWSD